MDLSQTFPLMNDEGGQTARVRDEYRGLRAVAVVPQPKNSLNRVTRRGPKPPDTHREVH
jgi:hypothetical protein